MRHILLLTLLLSSLVACDGASTAPTPTVSTVVISPESATLGSPSETRQLTAEARDSSGALISEKTFVWSSGDESVATVSQSGLVTAVANGTTTITATTDGVTGSASITVGQV